MPQAIMTKHLPWTEKLPARIKASAERGSIVVPVGRLPLAARDRRDLWMTDEEMHTYVAHMLIYKFQEEDNLKYGQHVNHSWHHNITSGSYASCTYHCFLKSVDTRNENYWRKRLLNEAQSLLS